MQHPHNAIHSESPSRIPDNTTASFTLENLQKPLRTLPLMRQRVWSAAACVVLLAALAPAFAQDACTAWPTSCVLYPSETFFANGTTVQHIGVGGYAYFTFTVGYHAPRRPLGTELTPLYIVVCVPVLRRGGSRLRPSPASFEMPGLFGPFALACCCSPVSPRPIVIAPPAGARNCTSFHQDFVEHRERRCRHLRPQQCELVSDDLGVEF